MPSRFSFFRRHAQPRLAKHYLYVSDDKLDMLYEQIPRGVLSQVAAEVTVDLRVVSVRLTGAQDAGSFRAQKLAVVEQYIQTNFEVGTPQHVGVDGYFRGRLLMRWGAVGNDSGVDPQTAPMVLFVGREGAVTVALGGSLHHVLGSRSDLGGVLPGTALPMLVQALQRGSANAAPPDAPDAQMQFWSAEYVDMPGAEQTVEFLATAWSEGDLHDRGETRHVILGSPWYVAAARPEPPATEGP